MEEDVDSSDISAAELAAISNRGQFARSISLALSANAEEDVEPVTVLSKQDDGCQPPDVSSGTTPERDTACKDEVGEQKEVLRGENAKDDDRVDDIIEGWYASRLSDDLSSEESSISSDDDKESVDEMPLPEPASSHGRRRTRLQRQRLRRVKREFLAPFMRDNDFSEDIASLGIVQGADRPRQVPTLMELCMQTAGISRSGPLAPGLKSVLSHHQDKARLATQQLHWLDCNFRLLEKQIKWSIVDVVGPQGVKTSQLRRDARSLWRADWWAKKEPPNLEEDQWFLPVGVQALSAVDWKIAALAHYINLMLPHQYADSSKVTQSLEEQQRQSIETALQQIKRHLRKRYPKLVWYCFDHAVAYVWWARGRCARAQEAFVKIAQSYPADKCTEYERSTLWARHRAMVLVEIGRMLTTFDKRDTAGLFYREAVEAASQEVHPDEVLKLTLQSLALTASAYDQGLMDRPSAIQAANLWAAVTQQARLVKEKNVRPDLRNRRNWYIPIPETEQCGPNAVLAAVESLVHCHAGHPTVADSVDENLPNSFHRNQVWLAEARAHLEKLLTIPQCTFVGLYLSFVLAMQGEGDQAEIAYRGSGRVGESARVLSNDDFKPHPWWLFLEWIEARASAVGRGICEPLRVLPLVWRRGLGHPSYCQNRSPYWLCEQVADIKGMTPDLHVTSQGHLSSAMIQNLPPLRKVCIDARNGQICFDDSCCDEIHHQWDNYDNYREDFERKPSLRDVVSRHCFDCNNMLPCPNVIYTDPGTCTRVSLMIQGISRYYEAEALNHRKPIIGKRRAFHAPENMKFIHREMYSAMTAVFECSGKSVKIDIGEVLLQQWKKDVLGELTKLNEFDAASMKLAADLIDKCIKLRYKISLWEVKCFLKETAKHSRSSKSCQQHPPTSTADFAKHLRRRCASDCFKFEMLLRNVLYVGKATVVLLLHVWGSDSFVFLDCSSPSSFSQPVVRRCTGIWVLPSKADCWGTPNPSADILLAYVTCAYDTVYSGMYVFDEKGNISHYEKWGWPYGRFYFTCHGHKFIGLNTSKTKVVVCDTRSDSECWSAELPQIENFEQVVAQDTVYLSTVEGLYALDLTSLQPLVIVQLNPSLDLPASNDTGLLTHREAAGHLEVLGSLDVTMTGDEAVSYKRIFLGLQNHLLLVQRRRIVEGQLLEGEESPNVLEVVMDIMLPGKPVELCYIGEQAGFVVSATVFSNKTDPNYRENLYWFDSSGNIIAIHPFIGKGPHGFLPVYLRNEVAKDAGKPKNMEMDLYLYFADGLGALCCAKLDKADF